MVALPKLTNTTSWLIGGGLVVLILAVGIGMAVASPDNRVAAVVVTLILLAILFALFWQTMTLDARNGRVVNRRLGMFGRTTELSRVSALAVGTNGAGAAVLGLKTSGPKTYVPLLQLSSVRVARPASQLEALIGTIRTFVPAEAAGKEQTLAVLRAQADYVGAGGPPERSPLAPYVDDKYVVAGGQASVAISIFKLLG